MTSYLFTFTVYTTAMIGVIFLALFVYKKCAVNNSRVSSSNFLEIEDCVSLGVRKQLYVVRAGEEKFLIASDAERTTFLSKLESKNEKPSGEIHRYPREFQANEAVDFRTVSLDNVVTHDPRFNGAEIAQSGVMRHSEFDFDMQNLYSKEVIRKDAAEILRNIVSTGERRNG